MDEGLDALVVVARHVAPAVAHGHAGLPRVGEEGVRHLLLGGAVVFVAAADAAVNDEGLGIALAGYGGQTVHVQLLYLSAAAEPRACLVVDAPCRTHPAAVEPEDVHGAVVVRQFVNLVVGELLVALPALRVVGDGVVDVAVRRGPFVGPVVVAVPVGLAEVEAYPHVLLAEGVDDGACEVGLGGAVHAGVVGVSTVEHAVAVVVLGGENHVLHAGVLGCRGPLLRGEVPRVEGAVERLVGLLVLVVVAVLGAFYRASVAAYALTHNPALVADAPALHRAPLGVDAPVHHEAELQVLPLADALHNGRVALGDGVVLCTGRLNDESA